MKLVAKEMYKIWCVACEGNKAPVRANAKIRDIGLTVAAPGPRLVDTH